MDAVYKHNVHGMKSFVSRPTCGPRGPRGARGVVDADARTLVHREGRPLAWETALQSLREGERSC